MKNWFAIFLLLIACSDPENQIDNQEQVNNNSNVVIENYVPKWQLGISYLIDSSTMDTVKFSHMTHASFNQIDCRICHNETSKAMGIDLSCLKCHYEKSVKLLPHVVPLNKDSLIQNGIIH